MAEPLAVLTRPLRIFGWPMLVTGIGLLIAGIVLLVIALARPSLVVWARGESGQVLTVSGEPRESARSVTARVFADAAPTELTCTRGGAEVDRISALPGGAIDIDGRTWQSTITTVDIRPGDQVECVMEGAQELVLVERQRQTGVLKSLLFSTAGLGGIALGGTGVALGRRRS